MDTWYERMEAMRMWNVTPTEFRSLPLHDQHTMVAHYKEKNLRAAQAQKAAEINAEKFREKKD